MFSERMIETLRHEYDRLTGIDPAGKSYHQLIRVLDAMDQEGLRQLADAKIKFVSNLARNRIFHGTAK